MRGIVLNENQGKQGNPNIADAANSSCGTRRRPAVNAKGTAVKSVKSDANTCPTTIPASAVDTAAHTQATPSGVTAANKAGCGNTGGKRANCGEPRQINANKRVVLSAARITVRSKTAVRPSANPEQQEKEDEKKKEEGEQEQQEQPCEEEKEGEQEQQEPPCEEEKEGGEQQEPPCEEEKEGGEQQEPPCEEEKEGGEQQEQPCEEGGEKEEEQQEPPQCPETQEAQVFNSRSVPVHPTLISEDSPDVVEATDLLTRLTLENCVARLDYLETLIPCLTSLSDNGDIRASDRGVPAKCEGVNPSRVSTRPSVQIVEELLSRLDQLTERCETRLRAGNVPSAEGDENKQDNERNIVQRTEDTFDGVVETQYTTSSIVDDEAREEARAAE